ncbi:hypothetical protein MPH_02313 [Macrophomina phaseolina MS6]|uniref:Uncharacterized protein n=1 Tax=Macrophomina phaseolina (strain MS6) TaxID=1126212 RepID=K2S5T5_MACPH|nr:hypothetical protein MPH_02313 [Macrophomina phaseolina MS6]
MPIRDSASASTLTSIAGEGYPEDSETILSLAIGFGQPEKRAGLIFEDMNEFFCSENIRESRKQRWVGRPEDFKRSFSRKDFKPAHRETISPWKTEIVANGFQELVSITWVESVAENVDSYKALSNTTSWKRGDIALSRVGISVVRIHERKLSA